MLSRRKLIVTAVHGALLLGGAFSLAGCSESAPPTGGARESAASSSPTNLKEYVLAMQAVGYLGSSCLPAIGFAKDTPKQQLQKELTGQLEDQLTAVSSQENIEQQLEQLIRADFANQRLVDIEGWQLSETECRLAALSIALKGDQTRLAPVAVGLSQGEFVEVANWGPQKTFKGEKFNEQHDGHCGLWFKAQETPASAVLVFAGIHQATQIYADSFTSGLHGDFMQQVIDTPGEYSVELLDKASQVIQKIGTFQVLEPPATAEATDLDQCEVYSWGPVHAPAGQPFNEQPGGNSAFWVRTNCALADSSLIFAGVKLKTTVRGNVLTASVPAGHELKPGKYPLEIQLGNSERRLKAGDFRVEQD
jgi:hypothetical protein